MVSAIWNAASEGNLDAVKQLLQDHPSIDIEIKDHSGATPLIQAVRNGHIDVVAELLTVGGANPWNNPVYNSQPGGPEVFTTDEAILHLLRDAQATYVSPVAHPSAGQDAPQDPASEQQGAYPAPQYDPAQAYYRPMPPPGAEHAAAAAYPHPYFVTEGGYFLVPPPHAQPPMDYSYARGPQPSPPEATKKIPCRFYPNCRYGSSCHFAHPALPPQPGYYGAPPPGPHGQPFPHYDPNAPPPLSYAHAPPQFYPAGPYAPPPHQLQLVSPPPQQQQQPANSQQADGTAPSPSPVNTHPQSPEPNANGQQQQQQHPGFPPPPPAGYVLAPYPPPGSISPNGVVPAPYMYPPAPGGYQPYPYPPPQAQVPSSPTRQRNGEQQQQQQQGQQGGQQPQLQLQPVPIYPFPTYGLDPAAAGPLSAPPTTSSPNDHQYPVADGHQHPHPHHQRKTSNAADSNPNVNGVNGNGNGNGHVNGGRHSREQSNSFSRRPSRLSMSSSYGGPRKTSALCMFFPSGKCRNGDDCRFLHILPEDGQLAGPRQQVPYGLKKYRERGYSASNPNPNPALGGAPQGEFEVRYPNFGGGHSDKASIAQALASLPSNMKALNLSNGHRSSNGNPNGNGAPRNSNPPPLTNGNGNGNGNGHGKQNQSQQPAQRIPSEEDFPSLAGSGSTGIARSNSSLSVITSNGGKTAAQILKSSPPSASSPASANASKFRTGAGGAGAPGAAGGKEKETSVPPRSGESSASEKTMTDVESLKSAGTSATDQLTRPTSPEDAAADVPKPLPSTIEVPPIVA